MHQTRWFFERARGQFKNERIRQGSTNSQKKAFDLKNPKNQMFSKELFAKYINSFNEIYSEGKLVIGPHIVVRGNQKNFAEFMRYNFNEKPNVIYFQDSIAKAILFKTAEKVYGIKPNSIGDMRYITVPYSIAWLICKLPGKIDLYRIWKSQIIDSDFQNNLYDLMVKVEDFIKINAPGNLYGEWAKKEECWSTLKTENLNINLSSFESYLFDDTSISQRSDDIDTDKELRNQILDQN